MDKIIEKINFKNSIIMIVIAFVVVVLLSFLLLLQLGRFSEDNSGKSLSEYFSQMKGQLDYKDAISLPITDEVQAYLIRDILQRRINESAKIRSVYYENKKLTMNIKKGGITFPLSFDAYFEDSEQGVKLVLKNMKITNKFRKAPKFINDFIKKNLGLKQQMFVDTRHYLKKDFFIKNIEYKDDLIVNLVYDDTDLIAILNSAKKDVALSYYYKKHNNNALSDAIIIKNDRIEYDFNKILEVAIKNPSLLYSLAALYKDPDIVQINNLLINYNIEMSEKSIKEAREDMFANFADEVAGEVFVILKDKFKGKKVAINQGKPYDIDDFTLYTIRDIVEHYELRFDRSLYDRLKFIYDGEIKVAYKMDDNKYYIRGVDTKSFIDSKSYKQLKGSKSIHLVQMVDEANKWDKIVSFFEKKYNEEDIFIRYLRHAGDYYIAMISPASEYQKYFLVAFSMKDGNIKVIDDDIKEIEKFIINHENYPAQLFKKEMIEPKVVKVSEDTQYAIMDELAVRGIINSGDGVKIDYSSYDGSDYIYFCLSDGREFVFKVETTNFGTYLATLYDKEKAFRHWDDISFIITLEERPLDN